MRLWTISDLHVDYGENFRWVIQLSDWDYQDDLLIVAGDITDHPTLFRQALQGLRGKFHDVLFIAGNHDLWTGRSGYPTSMDAFQECRRIAQDCGIATGPLAVGTTWIVPLQGWYDYSFGAPCPELKLAWADFRMCKWPPDLDPKSVTTYFTDLNTPHLSIQGKKIISFSHFLPRIDLIPGFVPRKVKALFPVMGTTILEAQIRILRPAIHIYGHSHFNRDINLNGIRYVNNAFGYPHETRITRKRLLCLGDA